MPVVQFSLLHHALPSSLLAQVCECTACTALRSDTAQDPEWGALVAASRLNASQVSALIVPLDQPSTNTTGPSGPDPLVGGTRRMAQEASADSKRPMAASAGSAGAQSTAEVVPAASLAPAKGVSPAVGSVAPVGGPASNSPVSERVHCLPVACTLATNP